MQIYDVAGYHLRGLLKGLTALNLDVPAILESAALDPRQLEDPEVRFAEPVLLQLWQAAERRYTGELFSLEVGARIPFGALELIDYVVVASPTLGESIANLVHHGSLCSSGFVYTVTPTQRDGEDGMRLTLDHRYGAALIPRSIIEYLWALVITRLREHTAGGFQPHLDLREAPRGPIDTYRRVLGSVSFSRPEDALFVPLAQWGIVNPKRDPMLASLLARHARDVVQRIPVQDSFTTTVENAVADSLRAGDPSIEHVAAKLGLGPRTLQRRLAESGDVYTQLVDRVRRQFAERCLSSSKLSLAEIGYLLAYSEPSAFIRAFRRWVGMTPAEYRAQHGTERTLAFDPYLAKQ
jgi:AraC-like DNA-binding protein